jgi:hypothetical protein
MLSQCRWRLNIQSLKKDTIQIAVVYKWKGHGLHVFIKIGDIYMRQKPIELAGFFTVLVVHVGLLSGYRYRLEPLASTF